MFEVPRCQVQGGAVVPERHTARLPPESNRVLGPGDLLEQQIEQVPTLPGREIDDLPGEGRIDVENLLPGLRVHLDHRVDRRQWIAAHQIADLLVAAFGRCRRTESVLGTQFVEERLHRRRQTRIHRSHIGELSVTPITGHLLCSQDRMRRRVDQRRDVGVPTRTVGTLPLAVPGAVAMVVGGRGHRMNLRESDWGRIALVGMTRGDFAELGTERDLRRVVEVLPAEEHHLPPVQGLADRRHLFGR